MKKLWIALLLLVCCSLLVSTVWTYDFGTSIGVFTSTTPSTSFLPIPASGIARLRIGTGGGSFNLENPGLTSLGSDTELRMVSASNTSVNKFSVYDYQPGKTFCSKFKILFGNSSGGNADSGTFYFTQGDGAMFSDNNAYYNGYVFSGITWVLGSNGAITTTYRNGANWEPLGTSPFMQGVVYSVEIYGNNGTTSESYDRNGATYSISPNKQDIWVNGVLIGDELSKAGLANDSNIDSFLIYNLSSVGRVANCFLDNIVYSNSLPTMPTSQASALSFSSVGTTQKDISWANGSGTKRVVMVNTENSFIAPEDGTDPIANPVYNTRGQQVVYNGTGNTVTVSGLTPGSTYWVRIYEYIGEGLSTVYNTSPAGDNPSIMQTADETLPVELSSFTAIQNYQNSVTLTWITQSETNVHGFYVYRSGSQSLSEATVISPLVGATNTSNQQVYVVVDKELCESGLYYYWLQIQDLNGGIDYHGPSAVYVELGSLEGIPDVPLVTELSSVYPNPFNPETTICYQLEFTSDVIINVYNMRGQLVRALQVGSRTPGKYQIVWDGKTSNGSFCASGIYTFELKCGGQRFFTKAVLSK